MAIYFMTLPLFGTKVKQTPSALGKNHNYLYLCTGQEFSTLYNLVTLTVVKLLTVSNSQLPDTMNRLLSLFTIIDFRPVLFALTTHSMMFLIQMVPPDFSRLSMSHWQAFTNYNCIRNLRSAITSSE